MCIWFGLIVLKTVLMVYFVCCRCKAQTPREGGEQICTDESSSEIRINKDQQVGHAHIMVLVFSHCFLCVEFKCNLRSNYSHLCVSVSTERICK